MRKEVIKGAIVVFIASFCTYVKESDEAHNPRYYFVFIFCFPRILASL